MERTIKRTQAKSAVEAVQEDFAKYVAYAVSVASAQSMDVTPAY